MGEEAYDEAHLLHTFRQTANNWVDAHAAANLLEETKSHVLQNAAQALVRDEGLTGAEAERRVKASEWWKQWVEAMVEARTRELRLRSKMEYIKMLFQQYQSKEATRRAEMKL